jgi:hypothetical protein
MVTASGAPIGSDLEIALRARTTDQWDVELRYSSTGPAESSADIIRHGQASLDLEALARHRHGGPRTNEAYASLLSDSLFADPEIRQTFAKARVAASTSGLPLRVRLLIAPSAFELHQLRWETLLDPEHRQPLLMDSNVLFSRYLTTTDWRPVRLRMRNELRALVVVANPSDLDQWTDPSRPGSDAGFAAIDVEGEKARALEGLGALRTSTLAGPGQATLANIIEQLRSGFDLVYLVCHGYIVEDEPQLLLEKEDGTADLVHGRSFVQRIRELQDVPRLVVLASCQSAGVDDQVSDSGGAGVALGPLLVEVGVPAVLAMHGNVTMGTVETFIPTFLDRLQEHGRIDQAATEARSEIGGRLDWWAPVLFMRLRSGRLWYAAGFGTKGFGKWPALVDDIFERTCLPLLGPGMTDAILGTRQQLARDLANRYGFPLAPYAREDLPQVAQFLAVDQSRTFPVTKLRDALIEALRRRLFGLAKETNDPVPDHLVEIPKSRRQGDVLDELITEVWRRLHAGAADPFAVLARLDLPIYVTTQPVSLLAIALEAQGRHPRVMTSQWNDDCPRGYFATDPDVEPALDPDYRPTPERPLVFHIFGHLRYGRSVVIREDDYFAFLTREAKESETIPEVVRAAFAKSGLLFLGFRAEDWDFRVLFNIIMQQEGGQLRREHANVAAQVDPEAGLISEPEGARRYLESYFGRRHDVSIYWGSVDAFMRSLWERVEGEMR